MWASVAVISDVRRTWVLLTNWLPRKWSATECIFRTLKAKLFARTRRCCPTPHLKEFITPHLKALPERPFQEFSCSIYLNCKCTYLTRFRSFFHGPVAHAWALYCNPDHLFSLRRPFTAPSLLRPAHPIQRLQSGCKGCVRCGQCWAISLTDTI